MTPRRAKFVEAGIVLLVGLTFWFVVWQGWRMFLAEKTVRQQGVTHDSR